MQVHKIYYGPDPDKIGLHTSDGIRNLVSDDTVSALYTKRGSLHRTLVSSEIHETKYGPVLSLTQIDPCQSSDKRACTCNHTLLISLSSIVEQLAPFLNFSYNSNGDKLQPLHLTLKEG